MLKKAKAAASRRSAKGEAKDIAQAVLDSSHQIWLAGLGAFCARAAGRHEGVRDAGEAGRGARAAKTKQAAADTAAAARGAATAKAKEMQQMAGGTWDKLEQVFEDRVARALSKLGVYTQNDVQRLAERVDALSDAVNELVKSTRREAVDARAKARAKRAQDDARGSESARDEATAREQRRARDRRASRRARDRSLAVELLDLLDVVLHRVVLARSP